MLMICCRDLFFPTSDQIQVHNFVFFKPLIVQKRELFITPWHDSNFIEGILMVSLEPVSSLMVTFVFCHEPVKGQSFDMHSALHRPHVTRCRSRSQRCCLSPHRGRLSTWQFWQMPNGIMDWYWCFSFFLFCFSENGPVVLKISECNFCPSPRLSPHLRKLTMFIIVPASFSSHLFAVLFCVWL